MPLLIFPSSSLSKEISIWLTSLYLLGMSTEGRLLLCYSHASTHTHSGPRRALLPWEPFLIHTGTKWEEMPKSSMLKPLLLLPEHPRKHATYDLSLALSSPCCKVGSNSSLLLLAVIRSPDSRAHGCGVLGCLTASSREAPVVKREINWLTPWVQIYLRRSLAKTYRISLN